MTAAPRGVHRTFLALVGLVLLAGCGGRSLVKNPFLSLAAQTLEVRVHNLNWGDATLHVHSLGERTLLGRVAGEGSGTFEIPWESSRPIRLNIDLLAGGRCFTRELTVDPGDVVDLTITDGRCRAYASLFAR